MKLYSINTGYFKLDGGAMFGVVPKSGPLNLRQLAEDFRTLYNKTCITSLLHSL